MLYQLKQTLFSASFYIFRSTRKGVSRSYLQASEATKRLVDVFSRHNLTIFLARVKSVFTKSFVHVFFQKLDETFLRTHTYPSVVMSCD